MSDRSILTNFQIVFYRYLTNISTIVIGMADDSHEIHWQKLSIMCYSTTGTNKVRGEFLSNK